MKQEYLRKIDEVIEKGSFKDTWDSLGNYRIPDWYQDSKFGIFIHWGVYSVPAFTCEWYPRLMYQQGTREFEHHVRTYGAHKDFGYKDFIPMFKAEKFDPDEWLEVIKGSGAQYMIPVAEHHDGFQMYKSEISHWNAAEMGPRRDIIGELSVAAEEKGIRFGASSHRIEHWFFMGDGKDFESDVTDDEKEGDFYYPATKLENIQDIYSEPTPDKEFLEDWLVRCCEIVDRFHPLIVYFDWWIQHSAVKPYLRKFAAYYYNRAEEWGTGVVINYKHDAFMFGTAVVDIERGQFADAKPYIWQTDSCIMRNTWCHTDNNIYKEPYEIICDLIDIVSKNGRLLLNFGPKADGSIPDADKSILSEIGKWLKINGEGIYGSRVWRYSGEGPTRISEGQFADGAPKEFTSEDIRFTVKGSSLYAFALKFPENGRLTIKELRTADASKLPVFNGIINDVKLLGYDGSLSYRRDETGLHITAEGVDNRYPVTFKIAIA